MLDDHVAARNLLVVAELLADVPHAVGLRGQSLGMSHG